MQFDWLNLVNGLSLLGIPLVILIPLLIGQFRSWGMGERWTGPVAAVLGVLGMAAIQAIKIWPFVEQWITIPIMGILVGLASNGAYSQYKMWKTKLSDGKDKPAAPEPEADTEVRNKFGSR